MNKIIISFDEDIDPVVAVFRVAQVMGRGRISDKNIDGELVKHYCWVTTWEDGIQVGVRDKKTNNSADSFIVQKKEETNEN